MNIIEPNLDGSQLRVGIVQARFTNEVGSAMLAAAVAKLKTLGVRDDNITVTTVPGALKSRWCCNRWPARSSLTP